MKVQFRLAATERWFEGNTVDVSQSGVLFRTEEYPPIQDQTPIELILEMSALRPRTADVSCTGRVVRADVLGDGRLAIAVTIDGYRLHSPRPASDS